MQLSDVLEENSIKSIKDKTKISEENLEYLLASEFATLTKTKTLGFISILEREYKADLSGLREQAVEYYGQSREAHLFPIGQPILDEHRGQPKALILFILLLLGVSSWYFFTQFDKKHLNELIPFMDEQTIESFIGSDKEIKKETVDNTVVNTLKKDVVTAVIETMVIDESNESDSVQEENNRSVSDIL